MDTQPNVLPQTGENLSGGAAMDTSQNVSPRTNNVPNITAPSIGSSAMLVDLSISQWTGRKKDKKASKDVTADNNAESGVANVHKKLLGNCAELDAIHKKTGSIRNHTHYMMTMPWSDSGTRLLPTAQYFEYHNTMTGLKTEWQSLVDTFLSMYDWEISQAEAKLGDLFDRTEYPTASELSMRFSFNIAYAPLPDAGDFRVDIPNDAVNEIKKTYGDYYTRNIQAAMNDVWTRLHTALTNMSQRLDYSDSGTKNIFRDSLVTNVVDMIKILDVCNVTGDTHMTTLKNKLEDTMYSVSADVLRENSDKREETKRAVDKIISELPSIEI